MSIELYLFEKVFYIIQQFKLGILPMYLITQIGSLLEPILEDDIHFSFIPLQMGCGFVTHILFFFVALNWDFVSRDIYPDLHVS